MKLKSGMIFMSRHDGRIGYLIRNRSIFYANKKQWSLIMAASATPEDFNPHFLHILKTRYVYIGEL